MDECEFGVNLKRLGKRKIVYAEGTERRIRVIIGDVSNDGDFFIIDTDSEKNIWLNKSCVIAVKEVSIDD